MTENSLKSKQKIFIFYFIHKFKKLCIITKIVTKLLHTTIDKNQNNKINTKSKQYVEGQLDESHLSMKY